MRGTLPDSGCVYSRCVSELELWSFTFRKSTLPELAAAAGAAGFDAVTLTPELFVRSGGDAARLKAQVEDLGLRVTFVDGLVTALPGTPLVDSDEPTIDDCIHIAHSTGAGAINLVHVGGVATPVDQLGDAFAHACARAAGDGLRLAIEFLPGTGIPDFATAAAVVRAAGAPNGSVLLDTWHFARGGGTLADLDPASVALIGGLQVSDRAPEQDAEPYVPRRGRKIPGDGALPLAEMVRRVRAAHPDLPIGVEVLSEEIDDLGLDQGCRSLAHAMHEIIDDASASHPE
jgi:sugar phosphate isomerase/epimerase